MEQKIYGADPGAWDHFDLVLGLTEDLLPVVSDPTATKAPESTMQGVGKTPSRFNRKGEMVGFAKWTSHTTTQDEIARWQKDSRLGICIQTRHVRAIDVDVGDFDEAFDIEEFVAEYLGIKLPCRRRKNSTKFLLAFRMDGEFTKRRFKTHTEGNFVEFLANGQQFIAIGQHTSGVRYEWDGGLPDSIPTLGVDEFEALWMVLAEKFGSEDSVTTRTGVKPSIARLADDIDDPMMAYLADHWEVFNVHSSGRVDIRCPFEAGHSTDSGPTSTSYYPAGVGGFQKGHFKCLHASCAHRTDQDFVDAVGYSAHGFEVIEVETTTPTGGQASAARRSAPGAVTAHVKASGKGAGKVESNRTAVYEALIRPEFSGYGIAYDRFRDEIMITTTVVDRPIEDGGLVDLQWRPMRDSDYYRIAMRLENGSPAYEHIPREILREAVALAAEHCSFDSLEITVRKYKWDGKPRIETFLRDFMGAEDTPYTRAVSRYYWTALAGRALQPGIKADMVPIAVGRQGARKTTLIRTIAPNPEMFVELDLSKSDPDLAREMKGKIVAELGEMKGFSAKMIEHIKAFISRQQEEWTPKFKEFTTKYLRRVVFFGTTNDDEPLPPDSTGQRRWLPFTLREDAKCGVEELEAIRDQLWAEAVVVFEKFGIYWQEAEKLAPEVHDKYEKQDSWVEHIREYLFDDSMGEIAPVNKVGGLSIITIITQALSIAPRDIDRRVELRVADCLRRIGMKRSIRDKKRVWVYAQ